MIVGHDSDEHVGVGRSHGSDTCVRRGDGRESFMSSGVGRGGHS